MKISTAQLWVHNQDEALAFYTEKLGMEIRSDVTLAEMGDFRWLTVSPPGQEDIAIVLMAIPGPPMFEPETTKAIEEVVARGGRRHGLPDHRRLPGRIRNAESARGRVLRDPRTTPLRHRRGLPRPFRQQPAADPGDGDRGLSRIR